MRTLKQTDSERSSGKINWEKWKDPLRPSVNEGLKKKKKWVRDEDDDDEDLMDARDTFVEEEEPHDENRGRFIAGNMGIIPVGHANRPGKLFNFWMGESDFKITHEMAEVLEDLDGIETLEIYSPYRFRVGVGRQFDDGMVRRWVDEALTDFLLEKKEDTSSANGISLAEEVVSDGDAAEATPMSILEKLLDRKFPFWAVVRTEDGSFEYLTGFSEEEVEAKFDDFDETEVDHIVVSWIKEGEEDV